MYRILLAVVFVVTMAVGQAHSQAFVWDTTTGNWRVDGNWTETGWPGETSKTDEVLIQATSSAEQVTLDGDLDDVGNPDNEIQDLCMLANGSTAKLIIAVITLKVTGSLGVDMEGDGTRAATIEVQSDGGLTLSHASGKIALDDTTVLDVDGNVTTDGGLDVVASASADLDGTGVIDINGPLTIASGGALENSNEDVRVESLTINGGTLTVNEITGSDPGFVVEGTTTITGNSDIDGIVGTDNGVFTSVGTLTLDDASASVDLDTTASLDLADVVVDADTNNASIDISGSAAGTFILIDDVTVEGAGLFDLAQFNLSGAAIHAEADTVDQIGSWALVTFRDIDFVCRQFFIDSLGNVDVDNDTVEAGRVSISSNSGTASYSGAGALKSSSTLNRDGDFRSIASSNWNSGATWEVYDGTIGDWSGSGGSTPSSGSRVTIQNHTVTMNVDVSGLAQLNIDANGTVVIDASRTLTLGRGALDMDSNATIALDGGSSTMAELKLNGAIANGTIDVAAGDYGTISSTTKAVFGPDGSITYAGNLTISADYLHLGSIEVTGSGELDVTGTAQDGSLGSWRVNGVSNEAEIKFSAATKLDGELWVDSGMVKAFANVEVYGRGNFIFDNSGRIDTKDGSTLYTLDAFGEAQ